MSAATLFASLCNASMRQRGTTSADFIPFVDGDGSAAALGAPSVYSIIASVFKKSSLPDASEVATIEEGSLE